MAEKKKRTLFVKGKLNFVLTEKEDKKEVGQSRLLQDFNINGITAKEFALRAQKAKDILLGVKKAPAKKKAATVITKKKK